jgi:DNA-binding MarR family transcriptional regulator
MTAVVDRLVRRGYVERQSLESNRRSVYVQITPTGHEVAQEHRQVHFDEARGMLARLTPDEQALLVRAYRGLVASLEAQVQAAEASRE